MNAVFSFNFYFDLYFWLFFTLVLVIFRILSFNIFMKNLFLLSASILMLLALPRFDVFSLLFLVLVSALVFIAGILLKNQNVIKTKKKRIVFSSCMIIILIAILAFFKYSFLQEQWYNSVLHRSFLATDFIFIIGISYISFKMMHFIIESYKNQLKSINFLHFMNYIFFFPSFISGPINRYNHFCEQLNYANPNRIQDDLKKGLERIIHGLFKKLVLSTIVFPYAIVNMQESLFELNTIEIIIGLYAYTLYLYFDFAGYTDIALGSARIMGLELPENFKNPFFKKNIQQLWVNWHISFTSWLTDYIYWPITKKLRNNEYFRKRPILLSNISIIITFIICGMWHGETFNFVVWGLYHGIGLAILNIYQKQKRKIKNDRIRKYFKSKYSHWIGVVFTFNFFAAGIILFSLSVDKIYMLIFRML